MDEDSRLRLVSATATPLLRQLLTRSKLAPVANDKRDAERKLVMFDKHTVGLAHRALRTQHLARCSQRNRELHNSAKAYRSGATVGSWALPSPVISFYGQLREK